MDRDMLIARKSEVHAELARLHRQASAAEVRVASASGRARDFETARLQELHSRIDALIAEEHRLRLQIDRTR